MKKQTILALCIIALLLVVVGCLGVNFYVGQKNKKAENIEIFSCMPSEIVEYSVKDGIAEYTLLKDGEKWYVEGNSVAVLDAEKVQNLVNSVSRIVARRVLSHRELKKFDATDEQYLEIKLKNGTKTTLRFLGVFGEECALGIDEIEEVYSAHKSVRDILVADLDKLRASLVFEELKNTDDVLTYYSFTDYDKTKTVVRTKTAAEISNNKANRYIMEAPYKKGVDDERFEQLIAVRIPSIAITKYVDDSPEDLSEYGLDRDSRAVLTFKWGDFEETLFMGTNTDGQIYAIRDGKEGVFIIEPSQLEFLQTEPFYILESGILKADVENISAVTIKTKEKTFEITSSGKNGLNPQFFVNGKAASQVAFDEIAERLGDLEILHELSDVTENKQDILLTIAFDNSAGNQYISLSGINKKEYAVFLNGKAEFAINRESVEELFELLNEISKNPMRTK